MLEQQIELEKKMTQLSISHYRNELEKNKQSGTFGCTTIATKIMSRILDSFSSAIKQYLTDYLEGKPTRSTIAASVITRLNDVEVVAYIASKVILNSLYTDMSIQRLYRAIGQAIEDEYKMRSYKDENIHYYKSIQEDLNKRGAKANRKKNITTGVFNKRLAFHLDRWTVTEKAQTGLILVNLFVESTGLVELKDKYKKKKHYKIIVPTEELVQWMEHTNENLEVMQPFFLPMVCPPKDWTGIFEGGYISPYLKKNKLVKNNNKEYLNKLADREMPIVYTAINHIQSTPWQINSKVLEVAKELWQIGRAVAELPDREDEPLIPYPFPEKNTKTDSYTEQEIEAIKKWKRDTYEIWKRTIQKRSIRLLCSQILNIATQFGSYDRIWFPYQMDFRGRLYPIPVLLQPQGSDLAKGLLRFADGKPIDETGLRWLQIHGANTYGYDKESYNKRIQWVLERHTTFLSYVADPIENQGWAEADKPFQFLAWCFEYCDYLNNPDSFKSYLPIQLDGTCNGLQHYSALLRDEVGGRAVNLVNSDKPNDIYGVVATRLEEKLNVQISSSDNIDNNAYGNAWKVLGINRKLTKRPVMVLPYGGTLLSCREYIGEYLTDNYSPNFIWQHFGVGNNPTDCIFKVSTWLSKYLWEAIQETLKAATVGMDYLRKLTRILTANKTYIEWVTPADLLVRQAYPTRKQKEIKTELYGKIVKTRMNIEQDSSLDNQRQINGICPNFIHSLDAACLMIYLNKCKEAGINSIMSVHDCYGTHAADTEESAKFLREAFVEIYRQPILENFTTDVLKTIEGDFPPLPATGSLNIEEVLNSEYFFN